MRSTVTTITAAAVLLLAGCGEQGAPSSASAGTASWVLASAPAGAVNITDAKASAKEGDPIVLRGIIGGTMEPISAESPVFLIVDTGLYNKCTSGDDHCKTPWDYCCAKPEDRVANSATVQLVDASGSLVKDSPIAAGFKGLDEVVVVGTVGPRPDAKVLTVRATGVYRSGG